MMDMMEKTIRVLLADDHPLVRSGIRATLAPVADVAVVGEASDSYEAQRLGRDLQPDVLLLDLSMPGPAPAETVTFLRRHCPEIKVLVLTAYDNSTYVRSMLAAGVEGYILKQEAVETVVDAIHMAVRGGTWFSRAIVKKMGQRTEVEEQDFASVESALTEREVAVVQLVAAGRSNQEIGTALDISERTVRYRLRGIYDKLGVDCRAQAVARAVRLGLVEA